MDYPSATYRVQIKPGFNFSQLSEVKDYLKELGVSTIYAAPIFKAREGSEHGYDVADPLQINPAIGTEEDFLSLLDEFNKAGLSWLQDVVPNHMAYDKSNLYLMDVLEKGQHSTFAHWFDINWNHPDPELNGKVMTPLLGSPLEDVIKNGEIKLELKDSGIWVTYWDNHYPLSVPGYSKLPELPEDIKSQADSFVKQLNEKELESNEWESFKNGLKENKDVLKSIDKINKDHSALEDVLRSQFYRLSYWKLTEEKINYRRFFTVNELICTNVQDEDVFAGSHKLILQLLKEGKIMGVRLDHIDGLHAPGNYLQKLRTEAGKEKYIIVEKILEPGEEIPEAWPVQGTSGYDFLSDVSHVLTDPEGKETFSKIYLNFVERAPDFDDLVAEKKEFILFNRMSGELDNLFRLMKDLGLTEGYSEQGKQNLKQALGYFMVSLPVYRTYINQFPLRDTDKEVIEEAFELADRISTGLKAELAYLKKIFLGETDNKKEESLRFIMRCQQYTGPLAAKGVEDTAFYIYNRLISHNEVGDMPVNFGITPSAFHKRMSRRLEKTPFSLNTTATHDTKRGEDARSRINVLSEIPDEWGSRVTRWKSMNEKHKDVLGGKIKPDDNDEYFIYQAIVGGFPASGKEEDNFRQRLKDYMLKVVREAKVNTSWADPDEAYESSLSRFIDKLLDDHEWINDFRSFHSTIVRQGIWKSLAQVTLKIMTPGIPDIYQGTEFWDLSFVDPDNRRPVSYEDRKKQLEAIKKEFNSDKESLVKKLISAPENPAIKLFTTWRLLQFRKELSDVFAKGEYQRLTFEGEQKDKVIGFKRSSGNADVLVITPLLFNALGHNIPSGDAWSNTSLSLPEGLQGKYENIFTGETITVSGQTGLDKLLDKFPAGVFTAVHP